MTVNACSPMKIAGCESTRLTPSRSRRVPAEHHHRVAAVVMAGVEPAPGPQVAVDRLEQARRSADHRHAVRPVPPGSLTGMPRTVAPRRPPARRCRPPPPRSTGPPAPAASHGSRPNRPPRHPRRPSPDSTTTWVAATASNRWVICPAAVWPIPSVVTTAPIPSTVPRVSNASRAGRAVTPASASSNRSRVVTTAPPAQPGEDDPRPRPLTQPGRHAKRPSPPSPPDHEAIPCGVTGTPVTSVRRPSTIRT